MNYLPMGPTKILNTFQDFFLSGQSSLLGPALSLLAVLALITITWHSLMWSFDESGNALKEFLRKVIFIGFFIWFVKEFPWLTDQVIKGFIWAGSKAGSSSNISVMNDPSAIMVEGFRVVANLAKAIGSASPWELPAYFTNLIIFLLIILCYAIIAIQVFLVQVEFGIIATLGLILIPFGVLRPTSFIAEKVFGAVMSFGIKLMVLSFILSITFPILQQLTIPEEPNLLSFVNVFVASAMLAFLCWHAPSIAASMLYGSPSLSAQTASSGVSRTLSTVRQVAVAKTGGPVSAGVAATRAAARGGKP